MRAHEKPDFSFSFVFENERKSLEKHRFLEDRRVPERSSDNLIIASWNLTNFGLQKREKDHIKLIAEIMKPFDVIALQEIADDVEQFNMLLEALLEVSQDDRGVQWEYLYTDVAGNNERLAYVFRADRVTATGLAAEGRSGRESLYRVQPKSLHGELRLRKAKVLSGKRAPVLE